MLFFFFSNPSHVLPELFLKCENYSKFKFPTLIMNLAKNVCTAALYLVYPFAGYLADIRLGHYRLITTSLKILMPGLLLTLTGAGLLLPAVVMLPDKSTGWMVLMAIGSILLVLGYLPLLLGIVGIGANIIQLGLDQFYDKPSDDQVVFILWYMWTAYLARLLILFLGTLYNYTSYNSTIYYGTAIATYTIVLLAFACMYVFVTRRKASLVTDYHASRQNPYRMVFQVTKYASKNKLLVNREAFSQCNHDTPSGLDAGMQKYGGPFSNNLVEDVKAFYGILRVMIIGSSIFFFLQVSYKMNETLADHLTLETEQHSSSNCTPSFMMSSKEFATHSLSKVLVVLFVPCYVFFMRPLILYRMPRTLTMIGVYLALTLPPFVVAFSLDTAAHHENRHLLQCMFGKHPTLSPSNQTSGHYFPAPSSFKSKFEIYNTALTSCFDCLIVGMYTAFYRFICSQGPHSMKGFLVGLSFALTGFYELASPLFALAIAYAWKHKMKGRVSCGMVYYLVILGLGVVALLAFARTAYKYRYRRRVSEDDWTGTM